MISLDDYKDADPTGKHDSTKGIQRAIDEASHAGQPLWCPVGLYRVRTLYARNGLVMSGVHPGGYGLDVAQQTRFGLIAGTNASMFVGPSDTAHVRLNRIHFDGNKNNNKTGNVIDLTAVSNPVEAQWHITDCFIDAAPENGIFVGFGRRAVKISDCTVNYCGQNGIRINASDAHVDRCIVGSNRVHGIGVGGTVCNIESCDIYGNGEDGICIYSTIQMVGLHGNRIDRNKRYGISLSGRNKAVSITGTIFHSNGKQDTMIGLGCSEIEETANVHGTDT